MKSIGDRLGRPEKAKWKSPWGWIKREVERHKLLSLGGNGIVNTDTTEMVCRRTGYQGGVWSPSLLP